MSLLVGAAANSATGYTLDNSLRLRQSASASLNRTASSAPTNGKKVTVSLWIKRSEFATRTYMLQSGSGTGNDNYSSFYFNADNTIQVGMYSVVPRVTTQVFRDPSAWYHMVLAYDTTQASADNRVKLYINGEQVTSFTTNGTIPSDTLIAFTKQSQAVYIGTASDEATYLDAYIAEYNLIDGQQLAPTDFGETDDNGTWVPKKYTGTYGTNGFYLKFGDTSSVAALGTDSSGNGNTWTVNNVSLTAGATYDSMPDVPTLTDEDTSNFATLNPNNMAVNTTMTDGNLKASNASNHATMFPTNMPTTGKYYFECKMAVNAVLGLGFRTDTNKVESAYSDEANKYYYYLNNSNAYRIVETTNTALGANLNNTTSTFQVAIDFDAAKYYFGRDNTWYAADWGTDGDPASGTNPSYDLTDGTKMFPFVYVAGGTWTVNFGQQPFTYTPPSGFKKINTFNLPDSTIEDGSKYFDTALYTGTGSSLAITGLEFSPDLVWTKGRNVAYSHYWFDSVRGVGNRIMSNSTSNEDGSVFGVSSFDTNGFTLGTDVGANNSGSTFVGWNWKAGGTAVSNTDGSITSTVSANTTAGFSIVSYTGTANSTETVGHGLSKAPELILSKQRSATDNWPVYNKTITASKRLYLDTTIAATTTSDWGSTEPTSSVYTAGGGGNNSTGVTMISYCFHSVDGYSKVGSYTGNGSADGPFVYTGFRPAFVLMKVTSITDEWVIYDTARDTYNVANKRLNPNSSGAEQTSQTIDIVSNGFKPRSTGANINQNAETYIYMAFAKNPFKNSTAR